MSQHGPAQLELIRRYARTLREMHADAVRARGSRGADRATRVQRATSATGSLRQVSGAITPARGPRAAG
jgi:hypothetical protein